MEPFCNWGGKLKREERNEEGEAVRLCYLQMLTLSILRKCLIVYKTLTHVE